MAQPNHLEVVDIDGDNDKDVIVTSYQDDDLLWYVNDGSLSELYEIFYK